MIKYNYTAEGHIQFFEQLAVGKIKNGFYRVGTDKFNELIESGVEIAPYVEPVKTADQLKAELVQELKSLDASPRTLANALLGDQWAIDELKRLEAEKVVLRDKLKSL